MQVQSVNGSTVSFGARIDCRPLSRYMFMTNWNSKAVHDSLTRLRSAVDKMGTQEDRVVISGVNESVVNGKAVLNIEGTINNNHFSCLHDKELVGLRDVAEYLSKVLTRKPHTRKD